MLLFETPDITQLLAAWKPVSGGIMSSGVAYAANRGTERHESTVASLIPPASRLWCPVLAGFVMLTSNRPCGNDGALFMFLRDQFAQLPQKNIKRWRLSQHNGVRHEDMRHHGRHRRHRGFTLRRLPARGMRSRLSTWNSTKPCLTVLVSSSKTDLRQAEAGARPSGG